MNYHIASMMFKISALQVFIKAPSRQTCAHIGEMRILCISAYTHTASTLAENLRMYLISSKPV